MGADAQQPVIPHAAMAESGRYGQLAALAAAAERDPAKWEPRFRQIIDNRQAALNDRRDDHLCDPVAAADRKRLVTEIDQNDTDLTAIIGIDGAGAIGHGDTVF